MRDASSLACSGVATPPLPPPAPNCQAPSPRHRAKSGPAAQSALYFLELDEVYARGGAEQLSKSGYKEAEGPPCLEGIWAMEKKE